MSRPVRVLVLGRAGFVNGRIENISVYGVAVAPSGRLPSVLLTPGTSVEVEVRDDDGSPIFLREALIRHVTDRTIGLETSEGVPLELVLRVSGSE